MHELSAEKHRLRKCLWDRFLDRHGVLLDYAGPRGEVDLPDPADCREGRPNAIGWWSPIENGAFFTGLHLYGLSLDAANEPRIEDHRARLAAGLLSLSTCSQVPGFIGRGLGSDGQCHYPMGSDDQTHPWFLGLGTWILKGGTGGEPREAARSHLVRTAEALEALNWRLPCDGAFTGDFRGDLRRFEFRASANLLYILRLLFELTGETRWLDAYRTARDEREAGGGPTRLETCRQGCLADLGHIPDIRSQMWIATGAQASLRALAHWDPDMAPVYREGLERNGALAREEMARYKDFDVADTRPFRLHDWRRAFPDHRHQATQRDAQQWAEIQLKAVEDLDAPGISRRSQERYLMQQPLAAAAVWALAHRRENGDPTETLLPILRHYNDSVLHTSGFLFGELAASVLSPEAS